MYARVTTNHTEWDSMRRDFRRPLVVSTQWTNWDWPSSYLRIDLCTDDLTRAFSEWVACVPQTGVPARARR